MDKTTSLVWQITLALIILCMTSFWVAAQSPRTLIEVKNEQDVKEIKALVLEGNKLLQERNNCKITAKDYKQECICDKHEKYIKLFKQTDELTSNPSHFPWIDAVLSYEEDHQTKRTSIKRFYQINLDFNLSCYQNEDKTYSANHDWDRPELTIKNQEDIKELSDLYKASKKLSIAVSNCQQQGNYSQKQCECSYKEKTHILIKWVKRLDKKHPKWKEHVLVYMNDGYIVKDSWSEKIRKNNKKLPDCNE